MKEGLPEKITIILPVRNEAGSGYLDQILGRISLLQGVEVLVVDGDSEDDTCEVVKKHPVTLVETTYRIRAARINEGVRRARSPVVLLHHPRSLLSQSGLGYLLDHAHELRWGGFTHRFDLDHPLLKFTSWYSNRVRLEKSGIVYLDHCIFFRKSDFPVRGFKEVDLFEDTEISAALGKKCGMPVRLPFYSVTSAVRFVKNGIWTQAARNQILKAGYHLGISPSLMNRWYEKGLWLN